MNRLHIVIDGTWLFRTCAQYQVLAARTETPDVPFDIDFGRMDTAILKHVQAKHTDCEVLGDRFISTSIFSILKSVDDWPEANPEITDEAIKKAKNGSRARETFAGKALKVGYDDRAIFRPVLKPYMLERIMRGTFQEKQVDASVVALLVRSAIVNPQDYHTIITGDSDILPAIRVAYPEYTRNVIIATSHPDELSASHRLTSFSLNNFQFDILPFFFQDHIHEMMAGAHVYECGECRHTFARPRAINLKSSRPYCRDCEARREAYRK